MIINDLDGYYIVFDTKNWNTELDTLINYQNYIIFFNNCWLFKNYCLIKDIYLPIQGFTWRWQQT